MNKQELEQLRYPVGKFISPSNIETENIENWITTISDFPKKIATKTQQLTNTQLNWAYRPGGWTVKQVVHHCADSHMNCLIRFKLSLTEDTPTIRPYFEQRWATLTDAMQDDISDSLAILKAVHNKWGLLLEHFNATDWARTFIHPEHNTIYRLDEALALYDWHCRHHLGHVEQALSYKGKFE